MMRSFHAREAVSATDHAQAKREKEDRMAQQSLIGELPKIYEDGRREAARILDRLGDPVKIGLQTNELVLPAKDKDGLFKGQVPSVAPAYHSDVFGLFGEGLFAGKPTALAPWLNRLVYGDNLLVMAALLAGDEATSLPSLRGQVNLVYIDPPFDSKADYRTKIHLPGTDIAQKPTVIEQFAYSDTWKNGTASYLRMICPRLILLRELLADTGSIYVHLDWHVGHYVKVLMDEIFGKENFQREIIWRIGWVSGYKSADQNWIRNHDTILYYTKQKPIHSTRSISHILLIMSVVMETNLTAKGSRLKIHGIARMPTDWTLFKS